MTLTSGIFYLLTIGVILSGVLVITSKNPINSVVYLVACFVNCAAIFILLGMTLIGLIYIIVYVGAIAILFIFVIMMMDLRNQSNSDSNQFSKQFNEIGTKWLENSHYPLALIIAILLILFQTNNETITNFGSEIILNDFTTWQIASNNIWDGLLISMDLIHSVGYILYTDFLSLLLLVSLILLMVMIGVIALIKKPETNINN